MIERSARIVCWLWSIPAEFSPLDEIQQDFPHIARFYAGGRNARVLTGPQATFAALQQAGGDYDVINPTTHAVAFDTADRESYIVLAPGDGSDGIVPVHRIFDLKLNADLVMLVACQSGEGGAAAMASTVWPALSP
jgi:CHAT domain-containing protein